jgi:hypothetical protein
LDGVRGKEAATQQHQEADGEDSDGLAARSVHQMASVSARPDSVRPHTVVTEPLDLKWSLIGLSEPTILWKDSYAIQT